MKNHSVFSLPMPHPTGGDAGSRSSRRDVKTFAQNGGFARPANGGIPWPFDLMNHHGFTAVRILKPDASDSSSFPPLATARYGLAYIHGLTPVVFSQKMIMFFKTRDSLVVAVSLEV